MCQHCSKFFTVTHLTTQINLRGYVLGPTFNREKSQVTKFVGIIEVSLPSSHTYCVTLETVSLPSQFLHPSGNENIYSRGLFWGLNIHIYKI